MPRANQRSIGGEWLAPQGPREGLRRYAEVVRQRLRLIFGCVLLTTLVAIAYTSIAPESWKAESRLLVTPVNGESKLIGLGLITTSSSPGGDVSTAASLVGTPEVAALAAVRISGFSVRELLKHVSAVPVAQSNVVAVVATASNAALAQAIANAFAIDTVTSRTQTLHRQLAAIIPTLKAQVQALPAGERGGQGSLGERLALLQALAAAPDPTVSVASLAQRPTAPSWPRKKLTIVVGILVGLVIGIGGAFALEALDPRVRREESLRRIFRLPVLARIPRERAQSSHGLPFRPSDLSPAAQESYRMLRVSLGLRDPTTGHRSVMVTGSTRAEGKSSVALNLAAVVANAGYSVILVEADLHRPTLAKALGLHASNRKRGTAGVLMGEVALTDALVPVKSVSDKLRALLVEQGAPYLADGLLAASNDLVEQAESLADYVIFDAPPVTEVSDAVPLTRHVDDVVIVVRLGHSRTDRLVILGEVLTRQNVRPAGLVVVTDDVAPGGGYGYYTNGPTATGGAGATPHQQIPVLRD